MKIRILAIIYIIVLVITGANGQGIQLTRQA